MASSFEVFVCLVFIGYQMSVSLAYFGLPSQTLHLSESLEKTQRQKRSVDYTIINRESQRVVTENADDVTESRRKRSVEPTNNDPRIANFSSSVSIVIINLFIIFTLLESILHIFLILDSPNSTKTAFTINRQRRLNDCTTLAEPWYLLNASIIESS